jgi:hypothetical protein
MISPRILLLAMNAARVRRRNGGIGGKAGLARTGVVREHDAALQRCEARVHVWTSVSLALARRELDAVLQPLGVASGVSISGGGTRARRVRILLVILDGDRKAFKRCWRVHPHRLPHRSACWILARQLVFSAVA